MTEKEKTDLFTGLDWKALEDWAGTRTLERGRQYQRKKRVHDLVRSPGGALIAWVDGNDRYATAVIPDDSLTSVCTCPVGSTCKHAVAIILEYLALRKNTMPVDTISPGDPRSSLLGLAREPGREEGTADPRTSPKLKGVKDTRHSPRGPGKEPGSLQHYLEDLSREELIGLLLDLIRDYPHVEQDIRDRRSIASADADPVLDALLSDIDHITAEESWNNPWRDEYSIPDYSPVKKRMEILLSMGFPDAVVSAGRILIDKGAVQVEQSDDEGETAEEIASCMELVFEALEQSSFPSHERMLFAILADLDDDYDLCAGAEKFWNKEFSKDDWSLVADDLRSRLNEDRYDTGQDRSKSRYARDKIVDWTLSALDHAGRDTEATDLCIAEVDRTDSYVRLVRRLVRLGEPGDVVKWIIRGIEATGTKLPGIASELKGIRRELWEREGDWLRVAGMKAEEFLERPTFQSYRRLEDASQVSGTWDEIKDSVREFLETGKVPGGRNGNLFGVLPSSGLFPCQRGGRPHPPHLGILLDIAIADNRPDEVIDVYDKIRSAGTFGLGPPHDKVADCIAAKYPDRALAIWMDMAERSAAESRPKSYEAAVHYLRKVKALMTDLGRKAEWGQYIAGIRNVNARKRRFLEMLDVLEGKKILDS